MRLLLDMDMVWGCERGRQTGMMSIEHREFISVHGRLHIPQRSRSVRHKSNANLSQEVHFRVQVELIQIQPKSMKICVNSTCPCLYLVPLVRAPLVTSKRRNIGLADLRKEGKGHLSDKKANEMNQLTSLTRHGGYVLAVSLLTPNVMNTGIALNRALDHQR